MCLILGFFCCCFFVGFFVVGCFFGVFFGVRFFGGFFGVFVVVVVGFFFWGEGGRVCVFLMLNSTGDCATIL